MIKRILVAYATKPAQPFKRLHHRRGASARGYAVM